MPQTSLEEPYVEALDKARLLTRDTDEKRVDEHPQLTEQNPDTAILVEKFKDSKMPFLANAGGIRAVYTLALDCDIKTVGLEKKVGLEIAERSSRRQYAIRNSILAQVAQADVPADHRLQPRSSRLPQHRVRSIASLLYADVRKAENVECLGFSFATSLPVLNRIGAEFQKSRFLGVQLQVELPHSLGQFRTKLVGIRFYLDQCDVIDKAHHHAPLSTLRRRPRGAAPHDSGPMWTVISHSDDFFIHYTSPVYPAQRGETKWLFKQSAES